MKGAGETPPLYYYRKGNTTLSDEKMYYKNVCGNVAYAGDIRFAAGEVKELVTNKKTKQHIDMFIKRGVLVKTKQAEYDIFIGEKEQPKEEVEEDLLATFRDGSPVEKYASGKMDWRATVKHIDNVKKVEILDALYNQGKELNVNKNSAVMKAIISKKNILLMP